MRDGGLLIVAVPKTATAVDLVAENSGRPQTISLLDGVLASGYPLALYRPTREPAVPLATRIEMPVGESVIVEGTLTAIAWSAKDEDREWLPGGFGDLSVEIDDWSIDRPCCDVRVESAVATFTLLGPEPAPDQPDPESDDAPLAPAARPIFEDRREDPLAEPRRNRPPRFRVPEDLDSATLRVEIVLALVVGEDNSETVTEVLEIDLDL